MRGAALLLWSGLGLVSCLTPERIDLPEAQEGEQTLVFALRDGAEVRAFALPVGEVPPASVIDSITTAAIAFFPESLEQLGLNSGEQALTASETALIPPWAQGRGLIAELKPGARVTWEGTAGPPQLLAELRGPRAPRCPQICPRRQVPRLPEMLGAAEVGNAAVLLPLDAQRSLVASGNGFLFTVTEAAASPAVGGRSALNYAAGVQDQQGRSWLTGRGFFLQRIDPGTVEPLEVIATSSTTRYFPVHLDGGVDQGRVQLLAIGRNPINPPELLEALLWWNEGDLAWQQQPIPPPFDACEPRENCDAWRITWLARDRAILTSRRALLLVWDGASLQPRTISGCINFHRAVRTGPSRAILACDTGGAVEQLIDLDLEGEAQVVGRGVDLGGLDQLSTFSMLPSQGGLLLGASNGYLAFSSAEERCDAIQLGVGDIVNIVAVGPHFASIPGRFNELGPLSGSEAATIRWFDLVPPLASCP